MGGGMCGKIKDGGRAEERREGGDGREGGCGFALTTDPGLP